MPRFLVTEVITTVVDAANIEDADDEANLSFILGAFNTEERTIEPLDGDPEE